MTVLNYPVASTGRSLRNPARVPLGDIEVMTEDTAFNVSN